jgi:hypothetical protein
MAMARSGKIFFIEALKKPIRSIRANAVPFFPDLSIPFNQLLYGLVKTI